MKGSVNIMKYKQFNKLLLEYTNPAIKLVWPKKKHRPEIEIVPMPGGLTHVDLRNDIVYISALQFDHFLQKMLQDVHVELNASYSSKEYIFGEDLMLFILVHEFFHIKYKNKKHMDEYDINREVYNLLRKCNYTTTELDWLKMIF